MCTLLSPHQSSAHHRGFRVRGEVTFVPGDRTVGATCRPHEGRGVLLGSGPRSHPGMREERGRGVSTFAFRDGRAGSLSKSI